MITVRARPPNINGLKRHGSLIHQTKKVFNYFDNQIEDLVIQICSDPKNTNFDKKNFNFFKVH